jgi:hypothetical protein
MKLSIPSYVIKVVAKAIPIVDKIIFTAVFEMMSTKKQQEFFSF